ncbi:MAG TPA: diguanylate cyclase [Polyangiaceae bacterium]|jgi:diguanylate cyclase (GGDEF)-like protein|nr:diguanylate cyclase [Polyangiaceae bacterium]
MSRERTIFELKASPEGDRASDRPSAPDTGTQVVAAESGRRGGRILVVADATASTSALVDGLQADPDAVLRTSAKDALARLACGERFGLVLVDPTARQVGSDLHEEIARIAPDQAPCIAFLSCVAPGATPSMAPGPASDRPAPSSVGNLALARATPVPRESASDSSLLARLPLPNVVGVVIVADDDPSARSLMVQWLTRAGFSCVELATGQAAIDAVLAEPARVDALVLDANMPDMSGFGVLAHLRADAAAGGVPIIMVNSQEIDEADVARGVGAGAEDYLTRPAAGALLVAKVRAASERSRAERELRARLQNAEADANTDPLTRVMNRRAFDGRLLESVANSSRHREPLALVLIDIDHFKAINDEFGHLGGDRTLLHFAWALRRSIRAGDQPFRLGGDEFAVLLPKCDAEGAVQVIERLRSELDADPISLFRGKPSTIPFSAGIASAEAKNIFQVGDLIARADSALYAAKNDGRDRTALGV